MNRNCRKPGATARFGRALLAAAVLATAGCQSPPGERPEAPAEPSPRARALEDLGFVRAEEGWVLGAASPILFDVDKAELRPDALAAIASIAEALRRLGVTGVRVEGHTDSIGERGYNLTLSRRRAEAVAAELARHGVPATAIEPKGRGPDYPAAENRSSEGRARNRRVDIIVVNL